MGVGAPGVGVAGAAGQEQELTMTQLVLANRSPVTRQGLLSYGLLAAQKEAEFWPDFPTWQAGSL